MGTDDDVKGNIISKGTRLLLRDVGIVMGNQMTRGNSVFHCWTLTFMRFGCGTRIRDKVFLAQESSTFFIVNMQTKLCCMLEKSIERKGKHEDLSVEQTNIMAL